MSFAVVMQGLRMHRASKSKNGTSSRVVPSRRYRAEDDSEMSPEEEKEEYRKQKKEAEDKKFDDVDEVDKVSRARNRLAKYQTEWLNAMAKAKSDGARTPGRCERLVEARHPELRANLLLATQALQEAKRR